MVHDFKGFGSWLLGLSHRKCRGGARVGGAVLHARQQAEEEEDLEDIEV